MKFACTELVPSFFSSEFFLKLSRLLLAKCFIWRRRRCRCCTKGCRANDRFVEEPSWMDGTPGLLSSPPKDTSSLYSSSESDGNRAGEQIWYGGEAEPTEVVPEEPTRCISVGESLPYGPRLYYETGDNVVRMKDIGEKSRILLIGVVGSFTPDCWNRHLFRVLRKLRYYTEREVDYICCVSTNDPFTQKAWGEYLGCGDSVLMWADSTKRFTKAMGMNIVVPWLDDTIRSKRYVIFAEDMVVTKMVMSHLDGPNFKWQCEHLEEQEEEDEDSDSESWI